MNVVAIHWGALFAGVADLIGDVSGVNQPDAGLGLHGEPAAHTWSSKPLGHKGRASSSTVCQRPPRRALGGSNDLDLVGWADRCRERESLVLAPHFPVPYCEVVVAIVLGKVEAAELAHVGAGLISCSVREWCWYLNIGYR